MKATTDTGWAKLLAAANSTRADKIPDGYLTRQELAEKFGRSVTTIDRQIPVLLEAGTLVRGYYRRIGIDGAVRRMPHFKVAKK